ncbi:unnamed protein product [Rangifer tarandus platyrhynchus]|uniref:Uncharacterized protein n=2 Tax=Rangifer tarandus platyrhynchus TaxID=3082113 RepID=A0ACB0FIE9_RANTA|nr:unnamed protein product [Rangifer tarandus platyrhynchus]CAI9712632.1 unnamed protein product [Rangifer tarandus platyrhynchus]
MKAPEGHGSRAGLTLVCVADSKHLPLSEKWEACAGCPGGRRVLRPVGLLVTPGVALLPALGTAAGTSTTVTVLEHAGLSRCESDSALKMKHGACQRRSHFRL